MLEVEIQNFQSIEHVKIAVDGFTSLVGRSNIGKSSVVRAMNAALTGASGDTFVRHGPLCLRHIKGSKTCKCHCSVHLKTEGFDLLWEKGDAINRYVFNGVEKTAVNRGAPEFLTEYFAPVKVGQEKARLLQVADQFFPIFLLDEPGTVVADVLSDVARLDRINKAIQLAEKDRKSAAASRKIREKDVQELEARVEAFEGIDGVASAVDSVEQQEKAIQVKTAQLGKLEVFVSRVSSTATQVRALNGVTSLSPPEIGFVVEAGGRLSLFSRFESELRARDTLVQSLSPVEGLEVPSGLEGLKVQHQALLALDGWLGRLRDFKVLLTKWKGIEELSPPEVSGLQVRAERYSTLSALCLKYSTLQSEVESLEKGWASVVSDEARVQKEIDSLGVCPTCARPLGGVHLHGES